MDHMFYCCECLRSLWDTYLSRQSRSQIKLVLSLCCPIPILISDIDLMSDKNNYWIIYSGEQNWCAGVAPGVESHWKSKYSIGTALVVILHLMVTESRASGVSQLRREAFARHGTNSVMGFCCCKYKSMSDILQVGVEKCSCSLT